MAYNEIAFHGTIEPYAQNILAEQHFNPSTKPNEWLGYGIYFFSHRVHAEWWANDQASRHHKPAAVLSATLQYEDNAFFNLDLNENTYAFNRFSQRFLQEIKSAKKIQIDFNDRAQLRCFCMEAFKLQHPEIKLVSYTFDTPGRCGRWLFRPRQVQYCVIDHSIISNIELVTKGGVPT